MNAKVLERLRSEPEENHCRGQLHIGNQFCALGLMGDAIGVQWVEDDDDPDGGFLAFNGSRYHLPDKILRRLGIDGKLESDIIFMNDTEGLTFKEIADFIEEI